MKLLANIQIYNRIKLKLKLICFLIFFFFLLLNSYIAYAKVNIEAQKQIEEAIKRGGLWLLGEQKSDGSWPIVTRESHSSLVATGLFGLKTIEKLLSITDKDSEFSKLMYQKQKHAISFLLAHQNSQGYWEAIANIPWNKVEVTTLVLLGLSSTSFFSAETENTFHWLVSQQKENGSWNNDCWDTIWATYLLLEEGYTLEEEVVQKACNWLITDQRSKGYWKTNLSHLKGFGSLWTTQPALFTLAKTGFYYDSINKGLQYLKKEQNKNGSFGNWDASKTGMALYTFCSLEQYPSLMAEFRECANKAVNWFLKKQNDRGTWPGGFHPFDIVDTSFALWGLTKFLSLSLAENQK